jgi:hypothetical protein
MRTTLLIARLAHDIGGLVWSLDSDFERMARLKLVRLYERRFAKTEIGGVVNW